MAHNARLYAVGRGISASYEIFRPSAAYWGERNLQYAVEPRLPYHSMLPAGVYSFKIPRIISSNSMPRKPFAIINPSGFNRKVVGYSITP